jgi:4'-phosphopantetheinyl transferase
MLFQKNYSLQQLSEQQVNLDFNSIQLWLIDIQSFDLTKIIELLSTEEIQKGESYHFSEDRNKFLICRGVLRFLIGHYLGISGHEIIFSYNKFGKPEIAIPNLFFNLSHSGDFGLLAFSKKVPIGVDLELIRPFDYESIIKTIFSPVEQTLFQTIPDELKTRAFYLLWTQKEALIKGIGKGLSFPLTDFSVSLNPKTDFSVVEVPNFNDSANEVWEIYNIFFNSRYCSAIAFKKNNEFFFERFLLDYRF